MRYVDEGGAEALVKTGDLGTGLHAQLGIQVGKWLVEEEDFGLAHDGSTYSHTLALTTRKLLRLAVEQMADVENVGCFLYTSVNFALGGFAQLQTKRHVVVDTHVWVERVALEHHGDVAILGWHIVNDAVADLDVAITDFFQTSQQTQTGCLATTRGTDEDEEFLIFYVDVQVVDRRHIAPPLVDMLKGDACHILFFSLGNWNRKPEV